MANTIVPLISIEWVEDNGGNKNEEKMKVVVPDNIKPKRHLGVDWYLPERKAPIASTTMATSFLIECVAEEPHSSDGGQWRVEQCISSEWGMPFAFDSDAMSLMGCYVQAGYGSLTLEQLISKDFITGKFSKEGKRGK